jgi:hypothetical protein
MEIDRLDRLCIGASAPGYLSESGSNAPMIKLIGRQNKCLRVGLEVPFTVVCCTIIDKLLSIYDNYRRASHF